MKPGTCVYVIACMYVKMSVWLEAQCPMERGLLCGNECPTLYHPMSANAIWHAAPYTSHIHVHMYPTFRSFPATHVAFRMEQLAAGLWPSAHAAATTSTGAEG